MKNGWICLNLVTVNPCFKTKDVALFLKTEGMVDRITLMLLYGRISTGKLSQVVQLSPMEVKFIHVSILKSFLLTLPEFFGSTR